MSVDGDIHAGHRDRLRYSFLSDPASLSDKELLELLLTYAIPRRDTSPLAEELINRFTSFANILTAPSDDLSKVPGLGENSIAFLKIISSVMARNDPDMTYQPDLFNAPPKKPITKTREMRVFAEDEIITTLEYLPMAGDFSTFAAFKSHLISHLPYNSAGTRQRRANYIQARFYPDGDLNTGLTLFTHNNQSPEALKSVVFYHLAKSEILLGKVASEFVYPALPLGKIGREQLREFVLGQLPKINAASQAKVLRSINNAYALLGLGVADGESIKFQLHPGSTEAFLYILASEFPEPGIYSFESLFGGPVHRWMLWDREWIRKQLYSLRDLHIVSKVSEIDTIRQFSFEFGQRETLERFFKTTNQQDPATHNSGGKGL
jgi:DNA repair protein RadC